MKFDSSIIYLFLAIVIISPILHVLIKGFKKKIKQSKKELDTLEREWSETVLDYVKDEVKSSNPLTLENGIVTLSIRTDEAYAWSWFCNLKMAFVDEGCPYDTAAKGAARFLQIFAKHDITKTKLYKEDLENSIKKEASKK